MVERASLDKGNQLQVRGWEGHGFQESVLTGSKHAPTGDARARLLPDAQCSQETIVRLQCGFCSPHTLRLTLASPALWLLRWGLVVILECCGMALAEKQAFAWHSSLRTWVRRKSPYLSPCSTISPLWPNIGGLSVATQAVVASQCWPEWSAGQRTGTSESRCRLQCQPTYLHDGCEAMLWAERLESECAVSWLGGGSRAEGQIAEGLGMWLGRAPGSLLCSSLQPHPLLTNTALSPWKRRNAEHFSASCQSNHWRNSE